MPELTIDFLKIEAERFSRELSVMALTELYGVTDGKAVGTYVEHEFKKRLALGYEVNTGNSAAGIDLPDLGVDIKVTSIQQPQSSCPFKSARQKVFGLGYSLLVFVYAKTDDPILKTSKLDILHCVFVDSEKTADYQTTSGLVNILENNGNKDDLIAFMYERNLPIDDIEMSSLANELLLIKPALGYLTISNALQWRLQYSRVIQIAGNEDGVIKII